MITELCGAKRLGHFGRSQFFIALRLISLAQAGLPLTMESLHSQHEALPLPTFEAECLSEDTSFTTTTQLCPGSLPPPPTKNRLRKMSGENILNPVLQTSNISQSILNHTSTLTAPLSSATVGVASSNGGGGQAPILSLTSATHGQRGEGVGEESDDERGVIAEESDGGHPWTNFSDDDRGLITSVRKQHWSTEEIDAVDTAQASDQPSTLVIAGENSSSEWSEDSSNSDDEEVNDSSAGQAVNYTLFDSKHLIETDSAYAMTQDQVDYYTGFFRELQPVEGGFISGTGARQFFEMSKLSVDELSCIWALSDLDQDGKLNLEEFRIAMHLVVLRKNDVPLPNQLPSSLINPETFTNEGEPFSTDLADDKKPAPNSSQDSDHPSSSSPDIDYQQAEILTTPKIVTKTTRGSRWKTRPPAETADGRGSGSGSDCVDGYRPSHHLEHSTGDVQDHVLKSRPRPTPRKAATASDLSPPSASAVPPPPPPRNRGFSTAGSSLSAYQQQHSTVEQAAPPSSRRGELPPPTALLQDRTSPISPNSRSAQSPILQLLQGADRRQLQALIRKEKERNHTLLRLNNELNYELKEVEEQRINLGIQLNHLQPLDTDH